MGALLELHGAAVSAGSRALLAHVSVGVSDGDRVGVLGPNGAGKSTLLGLLDGRIRPESGARTARVGLRMSVLAQQIGLDGSDTVAQALGGQWEEWLRHPARREIVDGLLAGIGPDARLAALSGGQRRRVALARALGADADVVALDEPTNHLDVDAIDWLARHLRGRFARRQARGALVVVTHDRWFLDAVCEHIWEVVPGVDPGHGAAQIPGHVEVYDGSYAAYTLARAERVRQADQAEEKRRNLLRKELAWLGRGAPARTSKPRFHVETVRQLVADVPPPRDAVRLVQMATRRLGKDVIDLLDVTRCFPRPGGGETVVLDHVTWRLAPGERVGVVGANGSGKTTLLSLLNGTLAPTEGRVRRGRTVHVATLSQETRELDPLAGLTVVQAVDRVAHRIRVGEQDLDAEQMAERIGFTRERAHTRVAEISGGERRRLQLTRLLMAEPNVLLLDEPTNDLDTDTLASLEDLLDSYPGTLVVVSHDRYLLERATDHQVALLGDGTLRALPGGVEQYLQLRRAMREQRRSSGGHRTGPSPAEVQREAKKQAQRIERELVRARERSDALQAQAAGLAPQVGADPARAERLAALGREVRAARERVEALEDAWLRAAERAGE